MSESRPELPEGVIDLNEHRKRLRPGKNLLDQSKAESSVGLSNAEKKHILTTAKDILKLYTNEKLIESFIKRQESYELSGLVPARGTLETQLEATLNGNRSIARHLSLNDIQETMNRYKQKPDFHDGPYLVAVAERAQILLGDFIDQEK